MNLYKVSYTETVKEEERYGNHMHTRVVANTYAEAATLFCDHPPADWDRDEITIKPEQVGVLIAE